MRQDELTRSCEPIEVSLTSPTSCSARICLALWGLTSLRTRWCCRGTCAAWFTGASRGVFDSSRCLSSTEMMKRNVSGGGSGRSRSRDCAVATNANVSGSAIFRRSVGGINGVSDGLFGFLLTPPLSSDIRRRSTLWTTALSSERGDGRHAEGRKPTGRPPAASDWREELHLLHRAWRDFRRRG